MTVTRLAAGTGLASLLMACACPPFDLAGTPPTSAPDRLVASDEGPFEASDLVVRSNRSGHWLAGRIKNETGKLWELVDFEVTLRDASGERVASSALTFRDLAPGQTRRIGTSGCERIPQLSRERPAASLDIRYKGGELATAYVFALTKPAASGSLTYSDDAIHVAFRPTRRRIGLTAVNHTSAPMKIDWNAAAFVDTAGRSHRLVDAAGAAEAMVRTIVPPGGRVTKSVRPSDPPSPTPGSRAEATEAPIFPNAPAARALKGRGFSLLLPIEVAGKVRRYEFSFVILNVVAG